MRKKPDVVERLRAYENPNLMIAIDNRIETCRWAADEIERLRKEIAALREEMDGLPSDSSHLMDLET